MRYSVTQIYSFFFSIGLLLISYTAFSDNYTSVQTGNWTDPGTWLAPSWRPNTIPDNSQPVVISEGHIVTYNGNFSYGQNVTVRGTIIIHGDATFGNNLQVETTGELIIDGNLSTNGFSIDGKITVDGDYNASGGDGSIMDNGKLIIGGNVNHTSLVIAISGQMLVSGNYTQTGGRININGSGMLVVGKNFQNNWQQTYINNEGRFLVMGNLISNELHKSDDAQIAVLGDLIIGTWNGEILDCSTDCRPSLGCTDCQILDVIDPTHPDWILDEGITAFWWDDFNDNSINDTSEGSKWSTLGSGANVQYYNSPNKVLMFSHSGETGDITLWQTEEINIQCYKKVLVGGYTYNESGGNTSINNLYYRLKATAGGSWEAWIQLPRNSSGYNQIPDLSQDNEYYSIQVKWMVHTDARCWLDNVGIFGTAVCGGDPKVNPPTGQARQSFCSGATVVDLSATGTNVKWYTSVSGGSALPEAELLATGFYYASQAVDGTESSSRLAVEVTINPLPDTGEINPD